MTASTAASTSQIAVTTSSAPNNPTRRIIGIVAIAFLIIFALIEILPFVYTVINSFKCKAVIVSYPLAVLPTPPFDVTCSQTNGAAISATQFSNGLTFNSTTEGYRGVLALDFPRWTFNTFIFAISITLLRLVLDSMAGYALARLRFPGRNIIFLIILGTLMIPGVVLLIPRFILLKQLGMLGQWHGLIIPLMVDAFGVFLLKQFFEGVPAEIEEAAEVDGASRTTIFFRVVLPMATPALTALAIFSFQGQWNNFMDVLLIAQGNKDLWTLPLGLSQIRGSSGQDFNWHIFLASSVLTTLPMVLIFFGFQRYFVEGVSYSGLKG